MNSYINQYYEKVDFVANIAGRSFLMLTQGAKDPKTRMRFTLRINFQMFHQQSRLPSKKNSVALFFSEEPKHNHSVRFEPSTVRIMRCISTVAVDFNILRSQRVRIIIKAMVDNER